jgi:putative hemolysin
MDGVVVNLVVIALLVLVNAAFAGSELAVVSLRRSQLVRLAETNGRRGRTLLALADEPTNFLSTIQVGITLAGFLASATAAVSLAQPIVPLFGWLGGAADAVALVLVTLALAFVTLVFGELVPKRVAMRHPERWALAAAGPVAMIARVARPIVWLLAKTTDLVARIFGAGDSGEREVLTEAEVLDVIATETNIAPARRQLVEGVLELRDRTVREVLTPRRSVYSLPADITVGDAARALANAGHSRAPLVEEQDLDNTVGVVVLARLVSCRDQDGPAREWAQQPPIVPEAAGVQDVLKLLQKRRRQLALVADEHGSIVGIVTVEDLLEEIVGELYDELDRDLSPSDPRGYQRGEDGSFELPGSFPIHDLADLGLFPPEHPHATTVGGLLMDELGRIPEAGDDVRVGDFQIRAIAVDGTVVERVRVQRA